MTDVPHHISVDAQQEGPSSVEVSVGDSSPLEYIGSTGLLGVDAETTQGADKPLNNGSESLADRIRDGRPVVHGEDVDGANADAASRHTETNEMPGTLTPLQAGQLEKYFGNRKLGSNLEPKLSDSVPGQQSTPSQERPEPFAGGRKINATPPNMFRLK